MGEKRKTHRPTPASTEPDAKKRVLSGEPAEKLLAVARLHGSVKALPVRATDAWMWARTKQFVVCWRRNRLSGKLEKSFRLTLSTSAHRARVVAPLLRARLVCAESYLLRDPRLFKCFEVPPCF
ncbi:family 2 glycosyl transferase [Anopheles sinensis]|uniref:Family 2 glycosyl transferase n=1 Tax=Anopheles sinensis TaxID=74873 RepID=A0A084VCS7_ANOSI|nr:family 2 glycosyl transferase [Anopheles sinensis]